MTENCASAVMNLTLAPHFGVYGAVRGVGHCEQGRSLGLVTDDKSRRSLAPLRGGKTFVSARRKSRSPRARPFDARWIRHELGIQDPTASPRTFDGNRPCFATHTVRFHSASLK